MINSLHFLLGLGVRGLTDLIHLINGLTVVGLLASTELGLLLLFRPLLGYVLSFEPKSFCDRVSNLLSHSIVAFSLHVRIELLLVCLNGYFFLLNLWFRLSSRDVDVLTDGVRVLVAFVVEVQGDPLLLIQELVELPQLELLVFRSARPRVKHLFIRRVHIKRLVGLQVAHGTGSFTLLDALVLGVYDLIEVVIH